MTVTADELAWVGAVLEAVGAVAERTGCDMKRLAEARGQHPEFPLALQVEPKLWVGVLPSFGGGARLHLFEPAHVEPRADRAWLRATGPGWSHTIYDYPRFPEGLFAAFEMVASARREPEGWYRRVVDGVGETRRQEYL